MSKLSIRILFLLLLLPLVSCVQGGKKEDKKVVASWKLPKLMTAIPSDALIVEYTKHFSGQSSLLDENSPISAINYGKLSDNEAVISWCNSGSIVPILALSAENADSTSIASITIQAKNQKLFSTLLNTPNNKQIFLISSSSALISASSRHISEGVSIVDNKEFILAASNSQNHSEFIIARGKGAEMIANKCLPQKNISPKLLASFISNFARFYTFYINSKGDYVVKTVQKEEDRYYLYNTLSKLPFCESHLYSILPAETQFALSLPLSLPEFRYAYEDYLEAHCEKGHYQLELKSYQRKNKVDPKQWEMGQKLQEIAIVRFDKDGEVIIIRKGKKVEEFKGENELRDLIPLLYGKLFAIKDDSYKAELYAQGASWLIIGSESDVNKFLELSQNHIDTNELDLQWPKKNVRVVVYNSNSLLSWSKNGIEYGFS